MGQFEKSIGAAGDDGGGLLRSAGVVLEVDSGSLWTTGRVLEGKARIINSGVTIDDVLAVKLRQ